MPGCGVISGALLKSDDGVIWGYSWILSSFDEFYTSFFASFDWRVNSKLKKFIGSWLRCDIWSSAGDGVTWCVDISGCSHDQAWVSHIMHIIGECLPGWQWGLERVTSADDLDLLASSSCLRVTTLANSLESCCCWWYPTFRIHPPSRYPLLSCLFFRCPYRVHYITSDSAPPTRLSHISQWAQWYQCLFWELESWLLRSSWGDYCQHWISSAALSRCEHTKSSIFLFSTPCFVIEMQRVRWSVCSGHMFSVLILMSWIPIVQVSNWPMRGQFFWCMDQSEAGRVWRC